MKDQNQKNLPRSQFLKTDGGKSKSNAIDIPSISLPKGGGAIKGIDEKFSVNAVNGTASLSIALPVSAARGVTPSLQLAYNSGFGNGTFGLGWSLGLSGIRRKTDQGLPEYRDEFESDTFLYSDTEDLVPSFKKDPDGSFLLDAQGEYMFDERESADKLFRIRCYRPRVEGLFARIERWRSLTGDEIKWRVIDRDNVTTLLGWTENAQVVDPQHESRVFQWLPEFVFDDKGNCAQYIYKKEDDKGFDQSLLYNKNRWKNGAITYTNTYPEKVLYGNKTPYKNFGDAFPAEADYMFSTVFDYGEYSADAPYSRVKDWEYRDDAFSEYKSGFEIRTTRLCKRVLLFHHFTGTNEYEGLVKSLDFGYDNGGLQGFTFLKSITSCGYIKQLNGTYTSKKLPAQEFTYQQHHWNTEVKSIAPEDLVHAPAGIEGDGYQFTDLFNEGLAGIFTEQENGWYYKHNLGGGRFEPAKLVSPKPSFAGAGNQLQLADLGGDGGRQLVNFSAEPRGYFELDDDNQWDGFHYFQGLPNVNFQDRFTRMIDLNGDGMPEILISEDHVFTWYASAGREGYKQAQQTEQPLDEEAGPQVVFSDDTQSIFLADMSGDGMTDIVRIRNGEICYWPNLGFGKFGAKVSMENAPVFDHPEAFNPAYIKLADIDGSGTPDVIYLGKNKFTCWMNLSGNGFKKVPFEINAFPGIHGQATVSIADLLGTGLSCIVYSSRLPKDSQAPVRYIDLLDSRKPHVLVSYKNNFGKEVSLEYTPSTQFYIDDKLNGQPWVTRLHFPVHCVSRMEMADKITGHRFVSSYKYHHGYYDHHEREFRGFGMVEQTDAEHFEHWVKGAASNIVEQELHQEPVASKTWFHTGAFLDRERILQQFSHEYWHAVMQRKGFSVTHYEEALPEARLTAGPGLDPQLAEQLNTLEWGEALRACKGTALRSEIFAKDAAQHGSTEEAIRKELIPYTVATHNCHIELLQPQGKNKHAVYAVKESEAITYGYEREPDDPRITHNLNILLDEYGNVLESASVVYARKAPDNALPADTKTAQNKTTIVYTQNTFTNDVLEQDVYRLRVTAEVKTYELKGVAKTGAFYRPGNFNNILSAANSVAAPYHELDQEPPSGKALRRVIEHVRTVYYHNNLKEALPLYHLHSLALPFESYQLAYTPDLLNDIYGTKVDDSIMTEGKFVHSEGDNNWWVRSGTTQYIEGTENATSAQNRFYIPLSYTDPYGATTRVKYDDTYRLFLEQTEDALGNKLKLEQFSFRTLSPQRIRDINGNFTASMTDELGMVKAVAMYGKGEEADDLTGLQEFTSSNEAQRIHDFFQASDAVSLTSLGKDLLGHATTRFVYDLNAYEVSGSPIVSSSILREAHFRKNAQSPIQISFEYTSGTGQSVMQKAQAEPGIARQVTVQPDNTISVSSVDTSSLNPPQLRWIGSGRTVLNNKGNAVKQYEPYFSATHQYESHKELVEAGVTALLYYDALGRLIETKIPDETYSAVTFNSWMQTVHDANDTVLDSPWYNRRSNRLIDTQLLAEGKNPQAEKEAADKAAKHAGTPTVMHLDPLGRPVLTVDHNKDITSEVSEYYLTQVVVDVEGNLRKVTDARGNTVARYKYDMLGNQVYQNTMDAGQRWLLSNILGNLVRTWDERQHEFMYFYDVLHRPVYSKVKGGDGPVALDHIFDRSIYGESLLLADRSNEAALQDDNVLGQIIQHFDTGGLINTPAFDFKGQPLSTTRKLFRKYQEVANWTETNMVSDLEDEEFTFTTETDAIGRITRQVAPDESIVVPSYNEGGQLNGVSVLHPGSTGSVFYIKDIDYNEKRQRTKIIYGNDVFTSFYYDRETFRLKRLLTRSKNNDPLQDLYYTYDPVGNITQVEDKNVPVVFFDNQKIEGVAAFTYDALYRIVRASGRESDSTLSYNGRDNWNDSSFMHSLQSGDPMALRNYTQQYSYDATGNITRMKHIATGNQWTRDYVYGTSNNRLLTTTVGSTVYAYQHHSQHGFITALPHLEDLGWNFREELVRTVKQKRTDGGTPETTYYQYDGSGQRIRKITENEANPAASPTRKDERIYLAGYETYRTYYANSVNFERDTLSLTDEGHRFAMVETVKRNTTSSPDTSEFIGARLVRYQLHNHLGSASMELDNQARVISYEEYHPFGTTAYQARSATIKAAAKRYRYTGMERDEETGLEYHSARYYLPWLGRWLSCDPLERRKRLDANNEDSRSSMQSQDDDAAADDTAQSPDKKTDNHFASLRMNTYCYVVNSPIAFADSNGQSPVSMVIKQAAKVGVKKALKEYIKTTIKSKIKDYLGKKVLSKAFAKQLAKDADNITTLLDSEWWEYVIEVIPIAGDAYGVASLGKKGKAAWDKISAIEKRLERLAGFTARWGEAGAKKIDDVIEQRQKIREASNATETLIQAHHVIPVEVLKKNEVAQAAVVAGFDFNAKANTWLVKRSEHLAGHNELNELLEQRLEEWARKNPGFTPEQAKEFLEKSVVPEWRKNFVEAVTY